MLFRDAQKTEWLPHILYVRGWVFPQWLWVSVSAFSLLLFQLTDGAQDWNMPPEEYVCLSGCRWEKKKKNWGASQGLLLDFCVSVQTTGHYGLHEFYSWRNGLLTVTNDFCDVAFFYWCNKRSAIKSPSFSHCYMLSLVEEQTSHIVLLQLIIFFTVFCSLPVSDYPLKLRPTDQGWTVHLPQERWLVKKLSLEI